MAGFLYLRGMNKRISEGTPDEDSYNARCIEPSTFKYLTYLLLATMFILTIIAVS